MQLSRLLLVISLLVSIVTSCAPVETPGPTPTPPQATPEPTPTATVSVDLEETIPVGPLGEEDNPFVMGLVSPGLDPFAEGNASAVAAFISKETGLNVQSRVYEEYLPLMQDMDNGNVHFAWLPPLTYLIANRAGYAQAALVTSHFGVYSYGFQILANEDTPFNVYFDTLTNQSTSDADIALRQLHEKRPCWVEPESPSGYVVPLGYFNDAGLVLQEGVITQSHSGVVRAIYVGGMCDFGVTYATYGDPRTAESLQTSLPDVMKRVIIVWQSQAVIPNLNVSFTATVSGDQRQKIIDGLIAYAKTDEGKSALSAANDYDIEGLKIIDDTYYADLRTYVDASGVKLHTLLGK